MLKDIPLWPEYASPLEALTQETKDWGPRLDTAMRRYEELDGELPSELSKLAIGIIDGDESPENFSMLDIYNTWEAEPGSFGALLLVNSLGGLSTHTLQLVDTICEQREATGIPTAIALVGYGSRRTDELRNDAWDIGVSHALHHNAAHPITGISNDADMIKTSPNYFPNMTLNEYIDAPATVWGTDVQFNLPGDPNLLLNRIVRYVYTLRQAWWGYKGGPQLTYGASMAMRLDTYAKARSWGEGPDPSNPMGRGEPVAIVRNISKRATGQTDTTWEGKSSLEGHAVRVEGLVEVSGRRESLRFSTTFLKRDDSIAPDPFTTSVGRSYRKFSYATLAELAEMATRKIESPALLDVLDMIDKGFLDQLSDEPQREKLKADLGAAREELDLPPSSASTG